MTVDSNGSAPEKPAEVAVAPVRRSRAKAAPPASGSGTESKPAKPATTAATEAAAASPGGAAAGAVEDAPVSPKASAPETSPRQISSPAAEPVDLVDVAGGSVMRRLAPYLTVAGILLIARIVVYSLRRRRK